MINSPLTLIIPFVLSLGSCTTIYNVQDSLKHEVEVVSLTPNMNPNPNKPLPKTAVGTDTKVAELKSSRECTVALLKPIDYPIITKDDILKAENPDQLVSMLAKRAKALETMIDSQNERLRKQNQSIKNCYGK